MLAKMIVLLSLKSVTLDSALPPIPEVPDETEVRSDILEYLSRKRTVESLALADRRGQCSELLVSIANTSDIYAYESTVVLSSQAEPTSYLICVEVNFDGTFNIEYFPE